MRILGITNLYPNPRQPNRSTFNREQFKALATAGHTVRMIVPIAWTNGLAVRRTGRGLMPRSRRTELDGIPIEYPRYLFTPKVFRGWYGNWYRLCVRDAFRRAVDEVRPDVVLATWAYPDGWAAVRLAREAHLPVVVKVHGSDVLLLGKRGPTRAKTSQTLREADGVISVSLDIAQRIAAFGADRRRVRVIYSGVDTSVFHPRARNEARARLGLATDVPTLLFVGNLVPVKGLTVLIDAVAAIVRNVPNLRCLLIGHGPQRTELEKRAAALGVRDRITFVGQKPHAELPDWFAAADVLVLPSWSEGVPNVLLEGAACGTPFVASRVGGIPEIAHLGVSRLVPPGEVHSFARAIQDTLAEGASERSVTTQRFRGHAQVAMEIATFLEEVACSQRPAPHPRHSEGVLERLKQVDCIGSRS